MSGAAAAPAGEPTTRDRFRGCLLGLAVGDALGTTLEFRPPGTFEPIDDMVGGGPFHLEPGQWTDDTSMALCLATSLLECGGFDAADQMQRYVRWWREGYMSSTGSCFDIGNTVTAALARFLENGDPYAGSTDPRSAGNGSLDYGLLVSEMKKYLEDGWDPVIKADVDGANSLPLRIDQNNSHFGRLSATRRAARAVYMGSAPRPDGRRGVDLKAVVLGCAQPGESPGQFADALRRLSGEATHLYVDGAQYWYSLIPNVTRIAADRASSNYDDRDADDEVRRRIGNQHDRGAFTAVQVFAAGPGDVPDNDDGVRLVILEPDATHSPNDDNSPAVELAARILAQRDAGPRVNPNLVVFLAAAANRLAELRAATRMYLAWKSIVGDQSMNLTAHQQRQADSKLAETSKQVDSLIGETFTLAITPSKQPSQRDVEWQTTRVTSVGDLAQRTSDKLSSEEKLISTYSGVRIRMDLDRRGLWSERGDIAVHKLWETYARFAYMPRLASRDVLYSAIANRASTITWQEDTFAYAEAHDGERWVGLHTDDAIPPAPSGLLIHPDHVPEPEVPTSPPEAPTDGPGGTDGPTDPPIEPPEPVSSLPTQFYAQFNLDPLRCNTQLGDIEDHVISKLGTDVELVLEVRSKSDEGFDESTRRTVSENARSLGAQSSEFE